VENRFFANETSASADGSALWRQRFAGLTNRAEKPVGGSRAEREQEHPRLCIDVEMAMAF
jgi:hypothetical protein